MKKILPALCCLLIAYSSLGQIDSKEYKELLNRAGSLYEKGELLNAASLCSVAIRIGGTLVTNNDRWGSACYWMAANLPDSAYYQLENVATSGNLTFDYISDLLTDDDCFSTLHNDRRWIDLKRKMFAIARNQFYAALKTNDEKAIIFQQYKTGLGFLLIDNLDSAFYYLNLAIESKQLTFDNAQGIINSNFVTALEKDKRWPDVKRKIFANLNKKYIPAAAFAKTKKTQKKLLIDGGHYNLHEIKGTYAPLAGTLRQSGFNVSGNEGKFDEASLQNVDMLIICNPHPDRIDSINQRIRRSNQQPRWTDAETLSAYTEAEASAIQNWVKNGGSFLLILDHAPFGQVGRLLTAAFGIENRFASTYDPLSRDPAVDSNSAKTILFTRSNGLIGKHPIMNGIDSVTTYTGESLIGPPGSDPLLLLPSTATDLDWLPETRQFRSRSAAGRLQAVAFEYGKGRVVMLGEAAITRPSFLSVANRGNWKFILNILRWLAREKMD